MTAASFIDGSVVVRNWRRPKALILISSAAAIAIIGFIDAVTGPDLSVLTFYFVPVLFATWFVGRGAGTVLSAVSAGAWIAIDLIANGGHIGHGVSAWNAAIHLTLFVAGVWMIGELKESLERQERSERRRIAMEIDTAREVQKALLPHGRDEEIRGFDVAASCEPAIGISGDFYELSLVDGDRLLLALGDVSGKGISAGLLGASLLGGLRSLAPLYRRRVDRLVAQLNVMLQKSSPGVRYATLFAAEYDYSSSTLHWVNAGHTSGLLFRPDSPVPERLGSTGTVVGLFPNAQWQQNDVQLERGDMLLLFSDGITEAADANEVEFGEQRIVDAVARVSGEPAAAIHATVLDAVGRFAGSGPLADDRTLVVLRRRA